MKEQEEAKSKEGQPSEGKKKTHQKKNQNKKKDRPSNKDNKKTEAVKEAEKEVVVRRAPHSPSKQEWEAHEITHIL